MIFDCEATFRRMQDFLDRELSDDEVLSVQDHLHGCGMCAEEYLFEASVLRRVRRCIQDVEVPSDLIERTLTALDKAG